MLPKIHDFSENFSGPVPVRFSQKSRSRPTLHSSDLIIHIHMQSTITGYFFNVIPEEPLQNAQGQKFVCEAGQLVCLFV